MNKMKKKGRPAIVGVAREQSGRVSRRAEDQAPTRANILRAAAMSPAFASAAGMAFLAKEITREEMDQAERVAKAVAAYRQALQIGGVASPSAEPGRNSAPDDPDTAAGCDEARRHAAAVTRFDRIVATLREAGTGRDGLSWERDPVGADRDGQVILNATIRFCTEQFIPTEQAAKAKIGLRRLVDVLRGGHRKSS